MSESIHPFQAYLERTIGKSFAITYKQVLPLTPYETVDSLYSDVSEGLLIRPSVKGKTVFNWQELHGYFIHKGWWVEQ